MSDRAAGGNATFRFTDTAVLSVSIAEAPIVVTSAEIDEALADTYARLDVRPGLLEGLAGIVERRWWPEDVTFADAAAMAGAKALADAGIEAKRVGLLIDTSVSRGHLEPSAAVDVFVVDTTGGLEALQITAALRAAGVRADRAFENRSMKSQMKAADRSGAAFAVIIGSNELETGAAVVRPLRAEKVADDTAAGQTLVPRTDLVDHLTKALQ